MAAAAGGTGRAATAGGVAGVRGRPRGPGRYLQRPLEEFTLMCDHCGCREFGRLGELHRDHQRILELAWTVAEGHPSGGGEWEAARDELVPLLRLHADKEETGLYPLLIAAGDLGPEQRDGLEEQHRDVDVVIGKAAFDRREYYTLAAHIDEEEYELFPSAMYAFDDDDWDELDRAHHAAFHRSGAPHDHGPDHHRPDGHGPDGHGPDDHGPDGHGPAAHATDPGLPAST